MWTIKHFEDLKAAGKIKGFYNVTLKGPAIQDVGGQKIGKEPLKRKSAGLDFIGKNLFFWCQSRCLVLEMEYKFHPERKWRFDFCIPSMKTAVEFEGGIFDRNGGHTSVKDFKKDSDKYNAAALLGWKVLRFNAINYKTLLTQLNQL